MAAACWGKDACKAVPCIAGVPISLQFILKTRTSLKQLQCILRHAHEQTQLLHNAPCNITCRKLSRVTLQQRAIQVTYNTMLNIWTYCKLCIAANCQLPAAACRAKPKLNQSLLPVILQPGPQHIARVARPVLQ